MPNLLIIGAGGIAHRHVENLRRIENLRIVGVCDLSAERAEKLARKADTRAFSDTQTALDATRPDYAAILTPRHVREPLIELCIAHALPFFVEKPPCDRLSVGRRIQQKINGSGLLHSVGFMHRWNESLNAVLSELKNERLSLIIIRFVAPFATAPVFAQYPDPYLVERSGGLVGDQGIHYVDIARYIAHSEVESIHATGRNQTLERSGRVTTNDAVCWTLAMRNGVLVNHSHTWCGADWDCQIDLVTDQSRICIGMFHNAAQGVLRGKDFRYEGKVDEFELEHRGFLRALELQDTTMVRSSFTDALESFRVAGEINRILYGHTDELDAL
ncbi:MAG: Gfo/Idh/MocA family oxidoreductase [bacterium]